MCKHATQPERTEAVRAYAAELGFDAIGFAPADDADPKDRLQAWLNRGFAADMHYMQERSDARSDPRILVPNAKSVIALAASYYCPDYRPEDHEKKISRYAMGRDYHGLLKKKVRKLRKRILSLDPDAVVMPTVDTSAVLEREWARRAGIAWTGKSTMAVSQELGTYTFLATLITTTEFVYDTPHPDRCGSCTRCLDACPTDAFAGPYELDSRKCITYWNVEHRAPFPKEAPPLHGWIAGCDICQDVCPWNKFAVPAQDPRLLPKEEMLQLVDLCNSSATTASHPDEERVHNAIQGTALQRTGAAHLLRSLGRS